MDEEIVDIEEATTEDGQGPDLTQEQLAQVRKAVEERRQGDELEEVAEVTGLVPAYQEADDLGLQECEVHDFIFLRTAKEKQKIKGAGSGDPKVHYHRSDTFYCRHCLRYTMMDRTENSDPHPLWFRDDK